MKSHSGFFILVDVYFLQTGNSYDLQTERNRVG